MAWWLEHFFHVASDSLHERFYDESGTTIYIEVMWDVPPSERNRTAKSVVLLWSVFVGIDKDTTIIISIPIPIPKLNKYTAYMLQLSLFPIDVILSKLCAPQNDTYHKLRENKVSPCHGSRFFLCILFDKTNTWEKKNTHTGNASNPDETKLAVARYFNHYGNENSCIIFLCALTTSVLFRIQHANNLPANSLISCLFVSAVARISTSHHIISYQNTFKQIFTSITCFNQSAKRNTWALAQMMHNTCLTLFQWNWN